jgi:hypothetical protein
MTAAKSVALSAMTVIAYGWPDGRNGREIGGIGSDVAERLNQVAGSQARRVTPASSS